VVNVTSHGSMTFPAPRSTRNVEYPGNPQPGVAGGPGCVGQSCLWFIVGCHSGCQNCTATGKDMYDQPPQYCINPHKSSLPREHRTWNLYRDSEDDWGVYRPWRSPGRAPNGNPCGMAGGYRVGGHPTPEIPDGFNQFVNGTSIPPLDAEPMHWKIGSHAEVGWSVWANHGGGYSYRLMPVDIEQTEVNFQQHHLDFVSNNSTIRFVDSTKDDFVIPGKIVNKGTYPKGSHWKRNPIPACNCDLGFNCYDKGGERNFLTPYFNSPGLERCPTGLQFEVSDSMKQHGIYGYGGSSGKTNDDQFMFSIIDHVKIPANYKPGRYMLSFRWDCEQTSQVWNQCADIILEH